MQKLELSPPLLIIVMGYPGAGKSYFSRQFSQQYNLPRVSQDRIRFELFEKPQFNKFEADIIDRVTEYMLDQLMVPKKSIVLEGLLLSDKQRHKIIINAHKAGYRTLTVWLQTDSITSMQRAANRDRRNLDDKHAFEVDKTLFSKIQANLKRPGEKEPFVVISGKHTFKSQCLTVLKKITSYYGQELLRNISSSDATKDRRAAPSGRRLLR